MTDWTVVLGHTAGGSVVILPGPTGATGPQGSQGPVGPIAAPDAKYFIDEPDDELINGITIPRGLGPDRVPASPDPMDDEMVTPETGYDPTKWTPFNPGTGVFSLDPVGGLLILSEDADSVLHAIEQPLPGAGPWAFTAKVSNASPYPGSTGGRQFLGLGFRNSTTGRWDLWYHARYDQVNKIVRSKANADSSFVSDTFSTWPDPSAFYYLRVVGTASNIGFQVSTNGINFITLEQTTLYCAVADRIGIFVYGNEGTLWPGYVQWFRRVL